MKGKRPIEIQCGDLIGAVETTSPGKAYRWMLKRAPNVTLAKLARFRDWSSTRPKWQYIEPTALQRGCADAAFS